MCVTASDVGAAERLLSAATSFLPALQPHTDTLSGLYCTCSVDKYLF